MDLRRQEAGDLREALDGLTREAEDMGFYSATPADFATALAEARHTLAPVVFAAGLDDCVPCPPPRLDPAAPT